MACNDKKCFDRTINSVICVNSGCSHSSHRNTYRMHELVSKVVITSNCSSGMMKAISSWSLKPASFKINGWVKN